VTHRWFNVDVGERELWLWGSPVELSRADRVKRMRDWLFNQRLVNAFDMSAETMDRYFDLFERFNPVCITGYPSSIALWVEHARRTGRSIATDSVRAVFVTGEVCYPHQRLAMESFFAAPVADGYGSREGGFIAHECEKGQMHVMADSVVVEIVDGDRPVEAGEIGEIVITHLDAYAMPFIRYRTGDRGRLLLGRCQCGRGLPLMDKIQGRDTDFITLPNGSSKHALSVIYPLRELSGVEQFRVIQRPNLDLDVQVVCRDRDGSGLSKHVKAALGCVMADAVAINVECVEKIESSGSGKHRQVISEIARDCGLGIDDCGLAK